MWRAASLLFLMIAGLTVVTFHYTQASTELQRDNRLLEISIDRLRNDKRVLEAEWAYLNNPKRLEQLISRISSSDMLSRLTRQDPRSLLNEERLARHGVPRPLVYNGRQILPHLPYPKPNPLRVERMRAHGQTNEKKDP